MFQQTKQPIMHIALQSIFAAVTLFSGLSVVAQENTKVISGMVTSFEESTPLEGVTIVAKGKKLVTGTLLDGGFSLPVSGNDSILVVSMDGYETCEIKISGQHFYEIPLKRNTAPGNQPGKKDRDIDDDQMHQSPTRFYPNEQ
jgi:hypothetical protein